MILAMNLNLASATPLPDKSSYSKIYSQIQSQPQLRDLYNGIVRHGIAQKCNAIEEKPLQIIQDSIMSDWFFRLSTATKLSLGKMIDSHIGSEAGKSGYCESGTTVDQNSNTRRQLSRQLDTLIVAYADFVPLVDIAKDK